jgi:hypothetical protein
LIDATVPRWATPRSEGLKPSVEHASVQHEVGCGVSGNVDMILFIQEE